MEHWKLLCTVFAVSVIALVTGCSSSIEKRQQLAQNNMVFAKYNDIFDGVVDCNGIPLVMVKIRPGRFMMGSPDSESGRELDECQRPVTFSKGFWIGKYEVTQAQWCAVMSPQFLDSGKLTEELNKLQKKKGKDQKEVELPFAMRVMIFWNNMSAVYAKYTPSFLLPEELNPSMFKGYDRPVENITWDQANEFCDRLNKLYGSKLPPGYRFALPTEAQWEYACRAGSSGPLNNGSPLTNLKHDCENLNDLAWYDFRGEGECTHPVGKKMPNAWGLHDMHGNVYEWCRDRYRFEDPATKKVLSSTSDRVARGGSWFSDAKNCRAAYRHWYLKTYRSGYIGFRVAIVSN